MRLLVVTQAVDQNDPILGFFHGWLLEFARQCETVEVICLREGRHDLPENVHVHSLGKTHHEKSLFIDSVRYVFRFLLYIIRYAPRYDAVFVHMNAEYILAGGLIWKLLRKRTALWYTHKSTPLKLWLAIPLVNHILTASPESFRIRNKKVMVTGHGIDTYMFDAPRPERKDFIRLVTVGRFSRSKNILLLAEAVSLLPRYGVPYRFSIVGDAVTADDKRYKAEVVEYVRLSGNAGWITFEGEKNHLETPAFLAAADIFLHASDTGSLDKALLEAMSERCIVISSNDAAQPILNSIDRRLAVKAEPDRFAAAIQKMHELSEEERLHLGEQLRAVVVAEHSLRRLITKISLTLSQT